MLGHCGSNVDHVKVGGRNVSSLKGCRMDAEKLSVSTLNVRSLSVGRMCVKVCLLAGIVLCFEKSKTAGSPPFVCPI